MLLLNGEKHYSRELVIPIRLLQKLPLFTQLGWHQILKGNKKEKERQMEGLLRV